jgi:hypothetical protein
MKNYRLLLFAILLFLSFFTTQQVLATPDAPRVVINPTTLTCDPVFYWRDECGEAILPEGWQYWNESTCPAGYSETDLQAEWRKYQTNFCCQARGGDYCGASTPLQTEMPSPIATPAETQAPAPDNNLLKLAGSISILTGIGLGIYGLRRKRKTS